MHKIRSQVTIVGGGIAGLWAAKDLIDLGLDVVVVEKSTRLATGSTTRNGGWLHAGTYHAVSILDDSTAKTVIDETRSGHKSIIEFVPECIEQNPYFALLGSDESAGNAAKKWRQFGIGFREVSKSIIIEDGWDPDKIHAVFAVDDKSVNSRIICEKLAAHILDKGGRIITGADFITQNRKSAQLKIGKDTYRIDANCFVVAAGVGTKKFFEQMTGQPFPMRFFKEHMLITPRITKNSYFKLESTGGAIHTHGTASIVTPNRDTAEVSESDFAVVKESEDRIRNFVNQYLPAKKNILKSPDVYAMTCLKVDISRPDKTQKGGYAYSMDSKISEPVPGFICAIPGKMTSAPVLGKAIADFVSQKSLRSLDAVAQESEIDLHIGKDTCKVNLRHVDELMQKQVHKNKE